MRTIEFRGYSPDRGWVFGDLLQRPNGDVYVNERSDSGFLSYLVRPETVGQYTGLEDARGNKVYEGDIVSSGATTGIVVYDCEQAGFVVQKEKSIELRFYSLVGIEVIGNIHDNHELLDRRKTEDIIRILL